MLDQTCADSFIGAFGADRSSPAWLQVYRAVDHGFAKRQCGIRHVMKQFPKSIEDFGDAFTKAKAKRHMADYDPTHSVALSEVIDVIDTAEGVIRDFLKSRRKDKRAFDAWVLLKKP